MYAPFRNGKKTNLSSRLGDGTKVVNHISLGHANTGILDSQGLGLLVGDDVDAQFLAGIELARVGQGLVADLVESIRGVRDKLSQENLLVGVESVCAFGQCLFRHSKACRGVRTDDQVQELADLSLEAKALGGHFDLGGGGGSREGEGGRKR